MAAVGGPVVRCALVSPGRVWDWGLPPGEGLWLSVGTPMSPGRGCLWLCMAPPPCPGGQALTPSGAQEGKTWLNIALAMEEAGEPHAELQPCFQTALERAEAAGDPRLQVSGGQNRDGDPPRVSLWAGG